MRNDEHIRVYLRENEEILQALKTTVYPELLNVLKGIIEIQTPNNAISPGFFIMMMSYKMDRLVDGKPLDTDGQAFTQLHIQDTWDLISDNPFWSDVRANVFHLLISEIIGTTSRCTVTEIFKYLAGLAESELNLNS